MRYEGSVYRPPSEGKSYILQVTIGCSHNKCTFCSMYKDKKFRVRNIDEIFEDLKYARDYYSEVKRIFLADGDALILKTKDLESILKEIKKLFPECERIGIYSTPGDILRKPLEDLVKLKELGLGIIYLGIESGSDLVLSKVEKGFTREEIIKAGQKAKKSGIPLSVTLISGLGGKDNWKEHALSSADLINQINPDYVSLLTLMMEKNTDLYTKYKKGNFDILSPKEIAVETKLFLKNISLKNSVFRSNHASNYIPLKGTLNKDREKLISEIDEALKNEEFTDERFRSL